MSSRQKLEWVLRLLAIPMLPVRYKSHLDLALSRMLLKEPDLSVELVLLALSRSRRQRYSLVLLRALGILSSEYLNGNNSVRGYFCQFGMEDLLPRKAIDCCIAALIICLPP
jgi:hypothetical protein